MIAQEKHVLIAKCFSMNRFTVLSFLWAGVANGTVKVCHQATCNLGNCTILNNSKRNCDLCLAAIAEFEGFLWIIESIKEGKLLLCRGMYFCGECMHKHQCLKAWMAIKTKCLLNIKEWNVLKNKLASAERWENNIIVTLPISEAEVPGPVQATNFAAVEKR